MNELVIMKDQQAVTTSLQVAESFERSHDNVLKAIYRLEKDVVNFNEMFSEGTEPDSYGRDRRTYFMNRDGFTLLAMGFTGKKALDFKIKYIEAFNNMEEAIKKERIQLPSDPMKVLELIFEANKNTDKKVERIDKDVDYLKNNQRLDQTEYSYISRKVSNKVNEYAQAHGSTLTAPQRSKLFKDINRGINEVTGVKTRSQLRQKDFDTADEFIDNWQPSTATVQIIKQMNNTVDGQTTLGA
ncbi:Rha family transcriptional regulator [Pediococcus pentosaceus]|uniref:Rha family transcriptional regulator n=1 Tax=Pediococcus pentosaceus TaxID=1255 RepID=UPI001E6521F6|nr:ORF6C domain-containing protein [Pediococcus pentosaceus]MCG7196755.1 ORF6C domain-containing protein [Pediococcus pentosaceus]MCI2396427.1 ORF6C domain-containing protein [Pediococcus pentosaceus]